MRDLLSIMLDFVFDVVKIAIGLLLLVGVTALALLIIVLAFCFIFGWLVDWRLSLASFPVLCIAIVAFNRMLEK